MNKLIAIVFLSLISFGAFAQTVSRYPEYQRVYEPERCYEVITQRDYNPAGAIIGGVVGYAIGREIDRDSRGYYGYSHPHRGYAPGRGHYYRTHPHYYHATRAVVAVWAVLSSVDTSVARLAVASV